MNDKIVIPEKPWMRPVEKEWKDRTLIRQNTERKEGGFPWWGKIALGATAVVVGGVVLYELGVTVFGAGPKAAADQLEYWSKEYAKELHEITAQNRLPTAAEEYALKKKQDQIDTAYNKLFTVYGVARDVLIAALAVAAAVWLASALARGYWNTHVGKVNTPAATTQLLRSAQAIDLYATGHAGLAVALQDQTQAAFQSLYSPAFQAEIITLQTMIPTLTGTQLVLTQLLVQNLQLELATTIPTLFMAARQILLLPPPF